MPWDMRSRSVPGLVKRSVSTCALIAVLVVAYLVLVGGLI